MSDFRQVTDANEISDVKTRLQDQNDHQILLNKLQSTGYDIDHDTQIDILSIAKQLLISTGNNYQITAKTYMYDNIIFEYFVPFSSDRDQTTRITILSKPTKKNNKSHHSIVQNIIVYTTIFTIAAVSPFIYYKAKGYRPLPHIVKEPLPDFSLMPAAVPSPEPLHDTKYQTKMTYLTKYIQFKHTTNCAKPNITMYSICVYFLENMRKNDWRLLRGAQRLLNNPDKQLNEKLNDVVVYIHTTSNKSKCTITSSSTVQLISQFNLRDEVLDNLYFLITMAMTNRYAFKIENMPISFEDICLSIDNNTPTQQINKNKIGSTMIQAIFEAMITIYNSQSPNMQKSNTDSDEMLLNWVLCQMPKTGQHTNSVDLTYLMQRFATKLKTYINSD